MKSKLSLRTERLNELTTDDLHAVAGAAKETIANCISILGGCNSYQMCTTAMSCGCPLTWNCQ